MSKSQRSARGVIWLAATKYSIEFISFVTIAFLARYVAPGEFGIMTFSLVFVLFASLTVETSLIKAVVQPLDIDEEYLHAAFWSQLVLAIVFALAVGIWGPFVIEHLNPEKIDPTRVAPVLLALLPIVVINASVGVPTAICERNLDFGILAIRQLAATLLGGIVAGIFAVLGFEIWALVVQRYVMSITAFILLWTLSGYRPKLRCSKQMVKRLMNLGLPIIAMGFLNFLNTQMTVFAVSIVAGLTALGLFNAANRLLQLIVQSIVGPVQGVGLSAFSQIQKDPKRASEILIDVQLIACSITVPLLIGLAIVAEYLIPIIFTDKWIGCVPFYWLLAPVGLVQSLIIPIENYLVGLGHAKTALKIKVAYIALLVPCLVTGSTWGVMGVIAGATLRGFISLPFIMGVTHRCTGYPLARLTRGIAMIVGIAASSAFFAGVLRKMIGLEFPGLSASLVTLATASILYLVLLRFLAAEIWHIIIRYFSKAR